MNQEENWRLRAIEKDLDRLDDEKASNVQVKNLEKGLEEVKDSIRWGSRTMAGVTLVVIIEVLLQVTGVI